MAYFSSTNKLNFNCLKAIKDSEALVEATNKSYDMLVKLQYYNFFFFHSKYHFSNRNYNAEAKMKSDRITVCEFNAGLYEKSLITAIKSLTLTSYPHISTVHMFLNYSLNAYAINFNLLENFLSTLLLIHPPTKQMFKYYYSVLFDCFISFNEKDAEKKNLFLYVLDALITSLQEPATYSKPLRKKHDNVKNSFDMTNHLYEASPTTTTTCIIQRKEFVYFENFTKNMKISRSLEVLNLIYQILECDFGFWVSSEEPKFYLFDEGTRPLISYIFWPERKDIGLTNHNVLKLLEVYISALRPEFSDFGIKKPISDLISLLVEVIRFSDKSEVVKYPFLGKKSNDFASEFSVKLYEDSQIQFALPKDSNFNCAAVVYFKQHWFNLLLRSHLLSLITNCPCSPELTTACDILEYIVSSCCKINNESKQTRSRSAARVNSAIVKKFKSYASINTKYCRGKTLLHIACEKNDVEKVKALLSFPELKINEIDDDGWTALHLAAASGSIDCLEELLKKRKRLSVDTRAQGSGGKTPLMCAATEGHSEICRLLLEHTGSILKAQFSFKNLKYEELHKGTVIFMCFELIQQYFLTYGTKEIFSYLKKSEFKRNNKHDALDIRGDLDYERFEKDITRNIPKLCKIVSALKLMPDFQTFSFFESILNFLKN